MIINNCEQNDLSSYVLKHILELMESRHMNYSSLADLSGIPQSTISTWFLKNHAPPVDKLDHICRALGISPAEFFSQSRYPKRHIPNREDHIHLKKWHSLTRSHRILVDSLIDELLP